ncbi:basic proline-rich protein-like [Motacilla alba alba]|uniref:basic proline-rich protein-like n=1 Tax=Motacilla alba alba TaxID=1094192 RepID=UPI0018D591BB|nr:basic proline-rich protein-like [Motacilla alba alba]
MQGKSPAWRTEISVHTHTYTATCRLFPARPSRTAVGGAQARAPPPAVGRAPPSPQRTPPAAPARAAPALPYWFPRSRAGRPLARTEQGAARGGAPEQSVIGRRRAPTFPPVPPRGAPASGARRRPAVRAGGGRSPGGRSRHRGRGPGWGQRRHTRRLPPRGKGSEAATLREADYGGDGRLFPRRRSASLPPRRPPRVAPGSPRLSPPPSPLPLGTCGRRGQRPHPVGNAGKRGCTAPDRRCQQVLGGFCPSRGFPRRLAPRRALRAGGSPTAHPSSSSPSPRLSHSSRCPSPTSCPWSLLSRVAAARAPAIPVPHHPRGLPSQPPGPPGCPVRSPEEPSPPRGAAAALPVFLFLFAAPHSGGGAPGPARGGVGGAPGRPPANRRQRCVGRRPMGAGLPRVIGGRAAAWPECQRGVSPAGG